MTLEALGYNQELEAFQQEQNLNAFDIGRVISEHKERYIVNTGSDEFDAELIGNLRFTAEDRHDFPAVGDWVAISPYDEDKALIHAIYPRKSIIERQAVGKHGQKQIIATNIDFGLIVQAVNRDFSINRLERYLTICNASKVEPIIILSKIDLVDDEVLKTMVENIQDRVKAIPTIALSSQTHVGYDQLGKLIKPGHTFCLLGS